MEIVNPAAAFRLLQVLLLVHVGQRLKNFSRIPDDGDLDLADLPDLRRVNIRVDKLRLRSEGLNIASDAIVEPRSDCYNNVGFLQ